MINDRYRYHVIREDDKYIVHGLTPDVQLALTDLQGRQLLKVPHVMGDYEIIPDSYHGYLLLLHISDSTGTASRMMLTR